MVLKVLFNSNHSVINVWKFKKRAFKFEQHYMIFFFSGLVMMLVLNTVPPFISYTQTAFVGGDVADGYNNRETPLCLLVL